MRATSPFVQHCVVGFILWVSGLLSIASAQLAPPASGAVIASYDFTMALKADGTVWTWGANTYGQLGVEVEGQSLVPMQVSGLSCVARISAAGNHALALKSDGTVWGWGAGNRGQYGSEVIGDVLAPTQILDLSGVVAIASGEYHDLAVKADGTVWGWGYNTGGVLGLNTYQDVPTPTQIPSISDVIAVAASSIGSFALKSDGTVWVWGQGPMGNPDYSQSTSPVQVIGLSGIIQIAAAGGHCMALKGDGTLYVWGENLYGELGTGSSGYEYVETPVVLADFNNVTFIAVAEYSSFAVKSDGTAWAWGANFYRQLGDGTSINRNVPVEIASAPAAVAVSANYSHTVLLTSDGALIVMGSKPYVAFGDGDLGLGQINYPVQAGERTDFTKVDMGSNHCHALTQGGWAWGWGSNSNGLLGDGTTSTRNSPALIGSLSNIVQVADGKYHSVFRKSDGTVWASGTNGNGQLGAGLPTNTTRSTPVQVTALSGITDVAAGPYHTLAVKDDGTVWAWGLNTNGRLGDGTTTQRTSPVQVQGPGGVGYLSGIIAVAAGDSHSLALKSDGTVWAWGLNTNGRLGDGTTTQRTTPVQVKGTGGVGYLSGITSLSAGLAHSLALKSDGTVWAWGLNSNGRLGDGTTAQRTTPVQLLNLSGVMSVAAGSSHSLALKSDGSLLAWGYNLYGQLGDGTNIQRTSPVPVINIAGVSAISAGQFGSLAVKSNGTMWIWGNSGAGQLGCMPLYRSISAINLKSTSFDSDSDGLPDAWEITYFGNLSQIATGDPDFDGLNNIREYSTGANPILPDADQDLLTDVVDAYPGDFYNGVVPLITIVGGNNQFAFADEFNAAAFDVAVWDPTGTTPIVNAPVTFEVLSGGGQLAVTNLGSPALSASLTIRTDVDGSTGAYYKQPATINIVSQIRASASTAQVVFTTLSKSTDVTPPSAPSGLFATALAASSFTLHWVTASDNVGVTGYDIFKNSSWVGESASTSCNITGLTAATAYSMTVKARDAAGNVSAASVPLVVTTYAPLSGAPGADFDSDGMSDEYELALGLDPYIADGAGQLDGDGVRNDEDARPNDAAVGRLSISISTPANGSSL